MAIVRSQKLGLNHHSIRQSLILELLFPLPLNNLLLLRRLSQLQSRRPGYQLPLTLPLLRVFLPPNL